MNRLFAIFLCFAQPSWAEPVVVFAASSLKAPLDEIFAGQDVVVSYGGSGAMAQQIAQGAPADIYISASPQWMDWLADQGMVHPEFQVNLLGNSLVLVGSADPPLETAIVTGPVAMGQAQSVPAGIYARQALETLGLWAEVEPVAIQVPSVTAAARLVALGEVPVGVVYVTDALANELRIIAAFPSQGHDEIVYPAAVVQGAAAETEAVWRDLQQLEALDVFAAHGFYVLVSP